MIRLPFGCGSIYENIKNEIKIFIETLSEEKQQRIYESIK